MFARLVAYVTRRRVERELDEELAFHVDMETQSNIARGMTRGHARRAALRDFGGVQQARDIVVDLRFTLLDGAWRDMRHGFRGLAATRAFSLSAIVALALGIGGSTLVFSVVEALLLARLEKPGRVQLPWKATTAISPRASALYPAFSGSRGCVR